MVASVTKNAGGGEKRALTVQERLFKWKSIGQKYSRKALDTRRILASQNL
jgi:hypothetical protein